MRFGKPAAALASLHDLAGRGGGKAPALTTHDQVEREIVRAEKLGEKWLALGGGSLPEPPRRYKWPCLSSICRKARLPRGWEGQFATA
jgi:hypothetical protein